MSIIRTPEVVDEVLNKAATDNKVKYRITHEDGTTESVQIDLLTPISTEGTAIAKAYLDTIRNDLLNLEIKSGYYTGNGNGTNSNFENLGYIPRFVFIFGGGSYAQSGFFINNGSSYSAIACCSLDSDQNSHWYFKDSNGTGDSRQTLTVTANGFKFSGGNSTFKPLNINGQKYSYIIFK